MKIDPITEYILQKNGKPIEESIMSNIKIPEFTANMIGGRLLLTVGQGGQGILAGAALFGAAMLAHTISKDIYEFYKDYIHKYGKRCSALKHNTDVRRKCEAIVKMKALEMRLKALVDAKKYCKKSKDQTKCVLKVDKEIQKVNDSLKKTREKLKTLD